MKRTQIYLDDDQDRRLAERARKLGCTKSAVIREAVEEKLAKPAIDPADQKARILAALADMPPVGPHLDESFREQRENDLRRQRELEQRWHGE